MNFIIVGTNHKYSPIELREKLSFSKKRIKSALNLLKENSNLKSGVIISTCNRVEIYADVKNIQRGINEIINFISFYHEIEEGKILPFLYVYQDKDAIRHLFEVTTGLDSLIIGETQIMGQVKQAFLESKAMDFTDKFLDGIFYQALSFAGKVHKETKISEGKVSVGSVAIDFIKNKIGSLADKNILIIGVGKVTQLLLKYLKKEKPNVIFISNRTYEKAKELANEIGAQAIRFDELNKFLTTADVIISATSSPHFIIKKNMLEETINNSLLIIDLALPRDVEPEVKEIQNVELDCLEDLEEIIEENKKKKQKEAEKVKFLIEKEVEKLCKKFTELEPEKVHLL